MTAKSLLSEAKSNAPPGREQRIIAALAQVYYFSGNSGDVIPLLEASKENIITSNRFLAMAYEQTGNYDRAIVILNNLIEAEFTKGAVPFKRGEATSFKLEGANALYDYQDSFAALAHIYAIDGRKEDKDKAVKMVEDLSTNKTVEDAKTDGKYISAYDIALIYAGLGNNANARKYLETAKSENDVRLSWLAVDPRFKKLRGDPEVRQWMIQNNYPREVLDRESNKDNN
jgi:tetratricopeptide (TPR) repeat protein